MGIRLNYWTMTREEFDALNAKSDVGFLEELFEVREPKDIDKSWHALHHLLTDGETRGDPSLYFILRGGTPATVIDEEEPCRYFGRPELVEILQALVSIDPKDLGERFDAPVLEAANVYPGNWREEDSREYIVANYAQLRKDMTDAVTEGRGMLFWLG